MIPPAQREVAAYLAGLAGAAPIQTHISAVFLGADTVWKLKKAVDLGFVDFTTLAAREAMSRRELALNAPAAPGMYRDVAAVVRRPGGLGLTAAPGPGEVVLDYVLRMARVPAGDFLDRMAAEGRLGAELLRAVADAVAAYHARLEPADADPVAGLGAVIEGNLRAGLSAGLDPGRLAAIAAACRAELGARAPWLAARRAGGFIRRAHGDLHLGNLCLWQGRPVAFDALEFDEGLATIDLGYDLAFLLMDLGHRLGRAGANLVLNRYVARGGDAALMVGLPLFLSLRAMVRAHVVAASGGAAAAAGAYLDDADAALADAGERVVVVAIGGLPGSGKSTLAAALAPDLGPAPGALILRSDAIRKRLHGAAPEQRLGADAYGAAANRATDAALLAGLDAALGGRHAVIMDATFMDPGLRAAAQARARAAGAGFVGLWLTAPLAVLEQRVGARVGDASDADVAVLRAAAGRDPGPGDWRAVDATDAGRALAEARALAGGC